MKLTEKCLKDFEKWFQLDFEGWDVKCQESQINLEMFYELKYSMQYGVYENFYDSVDLLIEIRFTDIDGVNWSYSITYKQYEIFEYVPNFKTRNEAQKEAMNRAKEIYNENK